MWDTRKKAERSLEDALHPYALLITEAFSAIDDCALRLERVGSPFSLVNALVVTKSRNLALGCYSLCLDGLAQESGALLRPLLESVELLVYFRLDPTRINEALEDNLPKAGLIAKKIGGRLKSLREHLNTHSSHLSLSPQAMTHLFDFTHGQVRTVQPHSESVLRANLGTLLAVLVWLATEAVNSVSIGDDRPDKQLQSKVADLKSRAFLLLDDPGQHPIDKPSNSAST